MPVDIVDEFIDVLSIILGSVRQEDDVRKEFCAYSLSQFVPDPSICTIQGLKALLFFALCAHKRNKDLGMPEIRTQLDSGYGYKANPSVLHVAGDHNADFMLDLKSKSLGSS
jgi:hypothetical protein